MSCKYEDLNILELKFSNILVSGPLYILKNYWQLEVAFVYEFILLLFTVLKIQTENFKK